MKNIPLNWPTVEKLECYGHAVHMDIFVQRLPVRKANAKSLAFVFMFIHYTTSTAQNLLIVNRFDGVNHLPSVPCLATCPFECRRFDLGGKHRVRIWVLAIIHSTRIHTVWGFRFRLTHTPHNRECFFHLVQGDSLEGEKNEVNLFLRILVNKKLTADDKSTAATIRIKAHPMIAFIFSPIDFLGN